MMKIVPLPNNRLTQSGKKMNWTMSTAWKVSKYGVISGPYFSVFGLNTERYSVSLLLSPSTGKDGPEITPYLDTFQALQIQRNFYSPWKGVQIQSFLWPVYFQMPIFSMRRRQNKDQKKLQIGTAFRHCFVKYLAVMPKNMVCRSLSSFHSILGGVIKSHRKS